MRPRSRDLVPLALFLLGACSSGQGARPAAGATGAARSRVHARGHRRGRRATIRRDRGGTSRPVPLGPARGDARTAAGVAGEPRRPAHTATASAEASGAGSRARRRPHVGLPADGGILARSSGGRLLPDRRRLGRTHARGATHRRCDGRWCTRSRRAPARDRRTPGGGTVRGLSRAAEQRDGRRARRRRRAGLSGAPLAQRRKPAVRGAGFFRARPDEQLRSRAAGDAVGRSCAWPGARRRRCLAAGASRRWRRRIDAGQVVGRPRRLRGFPRGRIRVARRAAAVRAGRGPIAATAAATAVSATRCSSTSPTGPGGRRRARSGR